MYKELLDFVNGDSAEKNRIGAEGKVDPFLYNFAKQFPQMDEELKSYNGYSAWKNSIKNTGKPIDDFHTCMKYKEYRKDPKSICFYIEKGENGKACFYVCLSIRPDAIKLENERNQYYSFLDLPLDTEHGLQYVVKYNSPHKNFSANIFHGTDTKMITDRKSAFEYIEREKANSRGENINPDEENCIIELCKIITDDDGKKTEEQLKQEVKEAVDALLPYYDYVLGRSDSQAALQAISQEVQKKISKENPKEEKILLPENENQTEDISKKKETDKTDNTTLNYAHNLILYGPPGTGKTYQTAIYAVAICEKAEKIEDVQVTGYETIMIRYHELRKEGRIGFTTFHQSFGYDDFIEGIRPVVRKKDKHAEKIQESYDPENIFPQSEETSEALEYEIRDGVFLDFCKKAKQVEGPCVFIIDELNRGNISHIFGELMTLIESSKREGMPEAVTATLPYSGEEFSVPSNVYIIGTMNTADRSIAMLDTALRRRFSFEEVLPDPAILKEMGADKVYFLDSEENVREIDVAKILDAINCRIEALYDRDHTIGQAYFKELCGENATIETLHKIFEKSIIPLLQEYFFDDYYKIHLILGDNIKPSDQQFIQEQELLGSGTFSTDTSGKYQKLFLGMVDEDRIELPKVRYVINKKAFSNPESYIHIYQE